MNTSELCGQPIVHRNDDGTITVTPCARLPGHQGRHRDEEYLAREREKAREKYASMSAEERRRLNEEKNKSRSDRRKL